ncbi:hypothetical protein M422DRAFT_267620 [Sphaerobolus stellatus SS14]|uniref:Uncharacterized protein n=1 Tax=Sphaerobolus stellatus (strain SS14) TaxID=990650 RepID=A0A0C9V035_SPHS4|nr:hypothetical protein M422DRAFT_267620 [Sphaerobolus stellatus SS14]
MDIRGIKLTNKDRDHLGNDPFEVLADVIPALDFDYMSKPENGECVIDLGISASPEADVPMVGLWNLTQVDASFAKAATNTPCLFNVVLRADPNEGFRSVTEVTNEVTLKNEGLEPKDLASTS